MWLTPLLASPLEKLEKKFMDFRRNAGNTTPAERKRKSQELGAEYQALLDKHPDSHSVYIELTQTDPRFIEATKGRVIQASDVKPAPDTISPPAPPRDASPENP